MPIDTRLARLEKRVGLDRVPDDDGDEADQVSPEAEAESRAILDEMAAMRLARRLGREPTDAELAEELAGLEARRAADAARLAEAGIKLRWSEDSLLVLERMREEAAARRRARELEPEGAA
jgi:hypothetical protein